MPVLSYVPFSTNLYLVANCDKKLLGDQVTQTRKTSITPGYETYIIFLNPAIEHQKYPMFLKLLLFLSICHVAFAFFFPRVTPNDGCGCGCGGGGGGGGCCAPPPPPP